MSVVVEGHEVRFFAASEVQVDQQTWGPRHDWKVVLEIDVPPLGGGATPIVVRADPGTVTHTRNGIPIDRRLGGPTVEIYSSMLENQRILRVDGSNSGKWNADGRVVESVTALAGDTLRVEITTPLACNDVFPGVNICISEMAFVDFRTLEPEPRVSPEAVEALQAELDDLMMRLEALEESDASQDLEIGSIRAQLAEVEARLTTIEALPVIRDRKK